MDIREELLEKYGNDSETGELVLVRYLGKTAAEVSMWEKQDNAWNELFTCEGQVGKNGVGKEKEGDNKTPLGVFGLSVPFGTLPDPGCAIPYTQLQESHYWCGDDTAYNRFVDLRETPHDCQGEHLIEYPDYKYALFIEYNKECILGKGFAIFFHCFGKNPYTAGCVAIDEPYMKTVLQHVHPGAKICIFES